MRRWSSWLGSVLSQTGLGVGGGVRREGKRKELVRDLSPACAQAWWYSRGSCVRAAEARALVPSLPFIYCVTLGKCCDLSDLSFLTCTIGRWPGMILKISLGGPSQLSVCGGPGCGCPTLFLTPPFLTFIPCCSHFRLPVLGPQAKDWRLWINFQGLVGAQVFTVIFLLP